MPAPDDRSPDSPAVDPQAFGSAAPDEHAPHQPVAPATARESSLRKTLGRVLPIIGGIGAAVLVAVSTGVITVPGAQDSTQSTQTNAEASLAAKQRAANQLWASATCTNILDWKNHMQRDATSLDLGLGALARIQDAIAATTRMQNELNKLGLPPAAQTAKARAEINQLRSTIASRIRNIQGAAGSLASGNLAAIGTLISTLNDTIVGPQIVNELRHVVSVDLGLSLVETRACRQLVGIPI
jgi:hypothetical protein